MNTNEVTINLVANAPGTNVVTINMVSPAVATNAATTNSVPQPPADIVSPNDIIVFWHSTPHIVHIAIIIGLAFAVHMLVKAIGNFGEMLTAKNLEKKNPLGF